ncbi:MAG: hypothetical protein H7239_06665 [Flavobacterium sp.]|nr:hypothetical protein [Flavobacterium sp.]
MTLQQVLEIYRFQAIELNLNNGSFIIYTELIRISDNAVMDCIRTILDISETNDFVNDSQYSSTPFDWSKIKEQTKRGQLDYYAQRFPINNFFPLNTDTDIASLI